MGGTALVLGGGPVGGAWLTGVLAGLAEAGIDLDRADVVIGTSAGAIFGSRLLGESRLAEMYERQLTGADRIDIGSGLPTTLRFLWAALGSRDPTVRYGVWADRPRRAHRPRVRGVRRPAPPLRAPSTGLPEGGCGSPRSTP
ncbi:patatin-like phospholipase family protein [Streptomyces sp. INA 01156]